MCCFGKLVMHMFGMFVTFNHNCITNVIHLVYTAIPDVIEDGSVTGANVVLFGVQQARDSRTPPTIDDILCRLRSCY